MSRPSPQSFPSSRHQTCDSAFCTTAGRSIHDCALGISTMPCGSCAHTSHRPTHEPDYTALSSSTNPGQSFHFSSIGATISCASSQTVTELETSVSSILDRCINDQSRLQFATIAAGANTSSPTGFVCFSVLYTDCNWYEKPVIEANATSSRHAC